MMRWLVNIHNAVSRVVLGKRLVEKTRVVNETATKRLDKLKELEHELNERTQEIQRESGMFVTNGNGH